MQNTQYRDMFYNEAPDDAERQRQLRLKNRRTGVAIFQASWILAFVSLAISNLMLRTASAECLTGSASTVQALISLRPGRGKWSSRRSMPAGPAGYAHAPIRPRNGSCRHRYASTTSDPTATATAR